MLPVEGLPWSEISEQLEAAKAKDFSWRDGRMAFYFYYLDDALSQVQKGAYTSYWTENNLGKGAFPSLAKLESELLEFGLDLMNAPPGAAATFTSGGSESIFLALQTARDAARSERGVTQPNFVVPRTAHPAFSRAGHALGIEIRRVPTTRADYRADVAGMDARIDDHTIGLVGSAPNYPFGVFDPIGELSGLAQSRGLWLHVDACVGGFLSPWVKRLGYSIPDWDFTVPGVTSISADLHKYGMAAKGASLMLLRSDEIKQRHQKFDFRDWERGQYATFVMQGTRPGGSVAAAWAVTQHLGEAGYLRCARLIMDAKKQLVVGVNAIDGLQVLEPHELCIFVTRARDPELDMAAVCDAMFARGWYVGRQVEPVGIHMALNPIHHQNVETYLADLRQSVDEVRAKKAVGTAAGQTY